MNQPRSLYVVFLLQLWRAEDYARPECDLAAGWRAALTDPATRESHKFANLAELFAFIEQQVAGRAQRAG